MSPFRLNTPFTLPQALRFLRGKWGGISGFGRDRPFPSDIPLRALLGESLQMEVGGLAIQEVLGSGGLLVP